MESMIIENSEVFRLIMSALGYGFLAGLAFWLFPWGVRLVLSMIKT